MQDNQDRSRATAACCCLFRGGGLQRERERERERKPGNYPGTSFKDTDVKQILCIVFKQPVALIQLS
jgi:hypothetical protein